MTEREQFIAWLNDARSTELAQIPVLQNHANDARDYPEIYERDMQHLEETRRQAEQLEEMIASLGGQVSMMKTAIGKVLGFGHSISTEVFPDELIKNFLADYAAEQFEIASYQSLIATARMIGEDDCVPVLERILREEIAMARWLEEHIPMATAESLKVVTGKSNDRRSRKSSRGSKKTSAASRLASPSLLFTLLGLGAVGTGATLLMRSKSDSGKRNLSQNRQNNLERRTTSEPATLTETNRVETVVITVDDARAKTLGSSRGTSAGNS